MAARLGVRRCTPGAAVHGPGAAIQATLSAAHLATATTDHPGLSGRMDQPPGPVSGPTMTTDLTLDPEVPCVGAEPAWAEGGSGQVAGGRGGGRSPFQIIARGVAAPVTEDDGAQADRPAAAGHPGQDRAAGRGGVDQRRD